MGFGEGVGGSVVAWNFGVHVCVCRDFPFLFRDPPSVLPYFRWSINTTLHRAPPGTDVA
jgi:hypothetical protein